MAASPRSSQFLSRRLFVRMLTYTPAACVLLPSIARAEESPSNTKWMRVRSVVELKGDVRLRDSKAVMRGATKTVPIESTSTLDYEENFRACPESFQGPFAYRHILEAKAENRINQKPVDVALRSDTQGIVSWMDGANFWTNSPDQPITANERDLLKGTIASAFVDEVLPKKAVRVGESWSLSDEVVRRLFQLEQVTEQSIKITLGDADPEKAQLEISGRVTGASAEVPTELQVQGKIQADRKAGYVSWMALNIHEKREIGEAEPGFDVEARVRLLRAPLEKPTASDTLVSAAARMSDVSMAKLLHFESKHNGFAFMAESDWRVLHDSPDQLVMRYVKNNTVIAQCNVRRLTSLEPGLQTTLEAYQQMIGRSLSESLRQILEGHESVTDAGLRMIKITAAGEAETVPVRWISILLSDDQGQRASMTFTFDESMESRFGNAEVQIAGGFRFIGAPSAGSPSNEAASATKVGSAAADTKR